VPNFDEISQSTAEIKLLSVSEDGRLPYWPYFWFRFWRTHRHRHVILRHADDMSQNVRELYKWNCTVLWHMKLPNRRRSNIHFSRWPPAAILDLIWVTSDYTRSAIAGLRFVLKFCLYSFGDFVIFIFCRFGLKLPIHANFWGVLGTYFSQIWSPIVLTPKRTILSRKHVVWAIKRENRCSGSTWA